MILSLGLFLLLNIPFILIFNVEEAVFGIPIIYLAFFSIWIASILISFIVIKPHYE